MITEPLVSLIVPIYNVADYIENCCISLMNQTYKNCEVVFINDCTKDNSVSIIQNCVKGYDYANVKIIHHSVNSGLACARNTGLENSIGEYIVFIDGDDSLQSTAIEQLVLSLQQTKADIVISDHQIIKKNGNTIATVGYIEEHEKYLEHLLLRKLNFNISGKLISRKLYDGMFFEPGINFGEDYLMYPKIVSRSKSVSKVNEPLYIYNKLNDNSYTNNISMNSIKQLCRAQEELLVYFSTANSCISQEILACSTSQLIVHLIKISYDDIAKLKYVQRFFCGYATNYRKLNTIDKILFYLFKNRMYFFIDKICNLGNLL